MIIGLRNVCQLRLVRLCACCELAKSLWSLCLWWSLKLWLFPQRSECWWSGSIQCETAYVFFIKSEIYHLVFCSADRNGPTQSALPLRNTLFLVVDSIVQPISKTDRNGSGRNKCLTNRWKSIIFCCIISLLFLFSLMSVFFAITMYVCLNFAVKVSTCNIFFNLATSEANI